MAALDWSLEAWRKRRVAELFDEEGWLSLAGLFWLEEGCNSIGPDPADSICLPRLESSPGSLVLENGRVTFKPASLEAGTEAGTGNGTTTGKDPAKIFVDGTEPNGPVLLSDDRQGRPSQIGIGDYRLMLIWRSDSLAIRLKDRQSQVLKDFEGPRYFPDNPALELSGIWTRFDQPLERSEATAVGRTEPETYHGKVDFRWQGKEWSLLAQERGSSLVIRFRDATSGNTTYGAFRFLSCLLPGHDGVVDLDFNRAYNPPCAFTPWATCSLPPAENRLPFAVEAGELSP